MNYNQCKDYLIKVGLICTKPIKKYLLNICENWEKNNSTLYHNIPAECIDRKYILPLSVKYSNTKEKINFYIYFKNTKSENQNSMKDDDDDEIDQCVQIIDYFGDIISEYSINNDVKNIDQINLNQWKNNFYSEFCLDFIFFTMMNLEENINSLTTINKDYEFKNLVKLLIKEDFERNDDYYFENSINKGKLNYNIKEKKIKINTVDNKELGNNFKKDCIEYGLKGDYIICTKYE